MKKNYLVVLQGDSITDAARSYNLTEPNLQLGNGYAAMLCADLRARYAAAAPDVWNRGVSGNRVVDLYARWKIDALNLKPDLISILIGVNDTWHEFESHNGVDLPRYERIYREILTWTRETLPDTAIVLIEPFICVSDFVTGEWVAEIAERKKIVRKLAAEFSLPLVTDEWFVNACKEAPPRYWLPDGVHPSYAGHRRLADAWLKVCAPLFE